MKAYEIETCHESGLATYFLDNGTAHGHIDIPEDVLLFPDADLGFSLLGQGFLPDVIDAFGLDRLRRIYQLQLLSSVPIGVNRNNAPGPHTYPHTRFVHSVGVAGIALRLSRQLVLDTTTRRTLLLTAMIHDALTPCGGDALKHLDMALLDEDKNILNLFHTHRSAWQKLRTSYNLPECTPQVVRDALAGKGLVGELMDIADTSSYLALDLYNVRAAHRRLGDIAMAGLDQVREVASRHPLDIWRTVARADDHACVTVPEKLYDFLLLRAHLWRALYQNPERKLLETLLLHVYAPYLLRTGKLRWGELTRITDRDLRYRITHTFGRPDLYRDLFSLGDLHVQTTHSAKNAIDLLEKADDIVALINPLAFPPISTKTAKYRLRNNRGDIDTFEQVRPDWAVIIRMITGRQAELPYYVVTFPPNSSELTHALKRAFAEAKAAWLEVLSTTTPH